MDMVRTNENTKLPRKATSGIRIDEGSNPPKRGGNGKKMENIIRKRTTAETNAEHSESEEDQPLIQRQRRLSSKPQT